MPCDSPPQEATIEASQIPHSEGGTPTSLSSSAPQHRYETMRLATTQGVTASRPQSSMRHPLTKRARNSGPGESSRALQPEPPVATRARAPTDFEIPSNMSPGSIIRSLMFTAPPIRATQIVNRDLSTRSSILIRRPSDISLSFETLMAYCRGTILSSL